MVPAVAEVIEVADRAEHPFLGVGNQLDAPIFVEQDQPAPVFGDIVQGLADWGFGRHAGTIGREPDLECINDRL